LVDPVESDSSLDVGVVDVGTLPVGCGVTLGVTGGGGVPFVVFDALVLEAAVLEVGAIELDPVLESIGLAGPAGSLAPQLGAAHSTSTSSRYLVVER
jgi:hypothetical protein